MNVLINQTISDEFSKETLGFTATRTTLKFCSKKSNLNYLKIEGFIFGSQPCFQPIYREAKHHERA
jgi:hypothetical protein